MAIIDIDSPRKIKPFESSFSIETEVGIAPTHEDGILLPEAQAHMDERLPVLKEAFIPLEEEIDRSVKGARDTRIFSDEY